MRPPAQRRAAAGPPGGSLTAGFCAAEARTQGPRVDSCSVQTGVGLPAASLGLPVLGSRICRRHSNQGSSAASAEASLLWTRRLHGGRRGLHGERGGFMVDAEAATSRGLRATLLHRAPLPAPWSPCIQHPERLSGALGQRDSTSFSQAGQSRPEPLGDFTALLGGGTLSPDGWTDPGTGPECGQTANRAASRKGQHCLAWSCPG